MDKKAQTFRFTISDELKLKISRFSQQYQYCEKEIFKEKWKDFLEENRNNLNEEQMRIQNLGYKGSFEKKIFTSARYYYRNKKSTTDEPKKRKQYVATSKDLIDSMDNFIQESLKTENHKPKETFELFCINESNQKLIKEEIIKLRNTENNISVKEIEFKIKKTYKNRYRLLIT